jgi:hypothetical protein
MGSGAERIEDVSGHVAQQPFGHLAARGVTGTEK